MRMATRDRKLPKVHGRLWSAVQEKLDFIRKKQKLEMMGGSQLGHLPWDLIYKIFFLLPAESLYIATLVCKGWKCLIKSSDFIESYTRKSDAVLVYLKTVRGRRPGTLCVGPLSKNLRDPQSSLTYIHFLEIQDGKGKEIESTVCGLTRILATCNGLILGMFDRGLSASGMIERGLAVVNPTTKKVISIPLGTILGYGEMYSLVFSHSAGDYKIIHIFNERDAYTSCEIFSLSKRSWWAVDGPSPGIRRFSDRPVEVFRSLHWLPHEYSTYTVAMGVDDETFFTIDLPTASEAADKLVEIRGCLAFLSGKWRDAIEVWVLSGLGGEDWEKRHTIVTHSSPRDGYGVPVWTFCFRRELVFRCRTRSSFYSYDLETEEIRMVEMEDGIRTVDLLPHLNTFASWDSRDVLR